MYKTLLLSLLLALAAGSTGCMFFRKSDRPKESSAIAREVEETFRRRWVDRRTSELVAQGAVDSAARTQAENEFRERYQFGRPGAK